MAATQDTLGSHSARPGPTRSQGTGGSSGLEVKGGRWEEAPVFELHHLLLPRTQAPSLGADGEYAIVLHAHLVQLRVVEVCLLCPQLQVDLLVTWKEEGPREGCEAGGVKPLSQNREEGALSPRRASSMSPHFIAPSGRPSWARLHKLGCWGSSLHSG